MTYVCEDLTTRDEELFIINLKRAGITDEQIDEMFKVFRIDVIKYWGGIYSN